MRLSYAAITEDYERSYCLITVEVFLLFMLPAHCESFTGSTPYILLPPGRNYVDGAALSKTCWAPDREQRVMAKCIMAL